MAKKIGELDIKGIIALNRSMPAKMPMEPRMNFRSFCTVNSLAPNAASMVMYSLFRTAHVTFRVSVPFADKLFTKNVFGTVIQGVDQKDDVFVELDQDFVPDVKYKTDDFTSDVLRVLKEICEKGDIHMIELVGAYQVAGLKERNVESYFRMSQADIPVTKIMNVIHYLSMILPRIIDSPDFQEHTKKINWLRYHTSAASSPQLVSRFIEDVKNTLTVTAQTHKFVDDAKAAPWDKAIVDRIPARTLALTFVYLEAAEQLPTNWYQGMKAVSTMAVSERAKLKVFFKKLIAINGQTTDLDASLTIVDLKAAYDFDI